MRPNPAVPDNAMSPTSTDCMGEEQGGPRRRGASRRDRDHGGPECPGPIAAGPRQMHDRPTCYHRSVVTARGGTLLRGHHVADGAGQLSHRRADHGAVRWRGMWAAQDHGCGVRSWRGGRAEAMRTDTPAMSAVTRQMTTAPQSRPRKSARERNGPPRPRGIRGRVPGGCAARSSRANRKGPRGVIPPQPRESVTNGELRNACRPSGRPLGHRGLRSDRRPAPCCRHGRAAQADGAAVACAHRLTA